MAYWHEASSTADLEVALVCVHGWPETKRIFERVVEPFVMKGFNVIVPDLRGFGDSGLASDGFYDVPSHARDVMELVFRYLGYKKAILIGGDLGGPVIQEVALRAPSQIEAMVLFNSPLPFDKNRMAGMNTRASKESSDYFFRQGTDADGLAVELSTEQKRLAYITEFYTTRLWAHPGAFSQADISYHAAPFLNAEHLRASFGNYESVFNPEKRSEPSVLARNTDTPTLILFGTSDHVIYPDFDVMAATVFEKHSGPIRLERCGHFVPWEAPERLVAETMTFLGGLTG